MYDIPVYGLLDSGANRIVFGGSGWKLLQNLGVQLNSRDESQCVVANNTSSPCVGMVTIPIRLKGVVKTFDCFIVPSVRHSLVLGVEFWQQMGIVPDLRRGEWHFSREPLNYMSVSSIQTTDELSANQRKRLCELVDKYLGLMGDKLGCCKLVKHKIRVTVDEPIKQRYYPVSPAVQKHIDNELQKMLDLDVIERSFSGWSSPVVMVPKKDKTYRFCVDYRKLNAVTEKDAYPLPYISTILDSLRNAKFLSSLDIKSAYWQILLEEDSRQYTSFTVPGRGLYQFKRLPFGLHNAPATFQRLADTVLGPDLLPYAFVYIDDIIICTPTFEKHTEILRLVLERLYEAGLTVSRDKCHFCRPQLKFLGYVVNREGLHVDPEKVQAIVNIPRPNNVSEVRRLIGMASWYRKFIKDYSNKIAPLTALLRKNKEFIWTEDCDKALSSIKNCLISAPILKCPNFDLPFTIQCDASGYAIGAVLTQHFDDGEHVICYLSRTLTHSERKYSVTERELLAVLWSVDKLRCYLEGHKFYVITDHYSLKWLDSMKDHIGRLGRWALKMQQYDFEVIHRKGKEHVLADTLSRNVIGVANITLNDVKDRWYHNMLKRLQDNAKKYPSWRVENNIMYKYVEQSYPELCGESDYWKEVLPKDRRAEAIRSCHDLPTAGHAGVFKTYHRVLQRYYWPKMRSDISRYIRNCVTCACSKPEQKRLAGTMDGGCTKLTRPWEAISIDLIGPLPRSKSGFTYIIVIVDCFSKFVLCFPLRNSKAPAILKYVEEAVLLTFGAPTLVICDNGVQFKSKQFQSLLNSYGCKIRYTAHYHPQANPVERVNRVIKTMLRCYVQKDHRDWDKYLPKIACAIRTAKHEVTGHTPYFINFGREMQLSGNEVDVNKPFGVARTTDFVKRQQVLKRLFEEVQVKLKKAYEANQRTYNLRRRAVTYQVGDKVYKRNFHLSDASKGYTSKLAQPFEGPFAITRRVGYNVYELVNGDGGKIIGQFHVKDLKPVPDTDMNSGT